MPGGACESVYAFIDQELGPLETEEFRLHLGKCESCHARILDAWTIDSAARRVMGQARVKKAPEAREGFSFRWQLVPAGMVASLLVMAGAFGARFYAVAQRVDPAVYAPFAYRIAEGRLTTPDADLHRRYESPARTAALGEGPASPLPPLAELSKLEGRGEYLGLAAAFLQRGKAKDALEYAAHAGESARADSDRAAILLFQGEPEKALELVDGALAQQPDLVQAKWNRALALRELEAWALAARMFEEVALRKEPGWSDEAAHEAAELRQKLSRRREAYEQLLDACNRMQAGGEPIPSAVAAAAPGHARECLEQLLAKGPSSERAEKLLPLALQLAALDGTPALSDSIRRLRSTSPAQAAATDPWSALLATKQAAAQEIAHGRVAAAIARMTGALSERCADHPAPPRPMDLRCLELRQQLARTLSVEHKPVEARAQALQAMRLAQQIGAWEQEWLLLEELGQIARHSASAWLARGYLEEVLERARGSHNCDVQDFAHGNLALMYQRALDFPRARHEVEVARECRSKTPYSTLLLVEADLARIYPPSPEEVAAFQERLAALRASAPSNRTARWMADHAEGRYFLEVQPQTGEALLRRTIRDAESTPDDVAAAKARAWSYTSLLLDAGKRGHYDQALHLFLEEMGLARGPQRCVLGVTTDDERTLIVLRDADGEVRGQYDASRKRPLKDVAGLVPPALVSALRGCNSVDVMARPPLQGMPQMLPADMAWGFLTGVSRDAPEAAPRRLVVTGARPPLELGLEPLVPYLLPAGAPAAEVLQDGAATPDRVLEAMTTATEVRIHGHGLLDGAISDAAFVALSADREGRFALTAEDVRKTSLKGHPVVVVVACQTSRAAPYLHEALSLPVAFIQGGARIVFAAAGAVPNDEAARFFEPLLGRLRDGQNPAVALMEARAAWKRNGGRSEWVDNVLVFRAKVE